MQQNDRKRWFDLTLEERRALIVIITLFLIGLAARYVLQRTASMPTTKEIGEVAAQGPV